MASKPKNWGGVKIKFGVPSPIEQLWYVGLDNSIVNVPTKAKITRDTCGNKQGANTPKFPDLLPPSSKMLAFIHTHPRWAESQPSGGDYGLAKHYDLYGIHDGGAWVIRKGTALFTPPITLIGLPPSMTKVFQNGKPCV
jgi:hypothetical protein